MRRSRKQDATPVVRQPLTFQCAHPTVDQIVRPRNLPIKSAKITGQTSITQIAPAKDNASRRKQKSDEPERNNVVWHLVDYSCFPQAEPLQMHHLFIRQSAG